MKPTEALTQIRESAEHIMELIEREATRYKWAATDSEVYRLNARILDLLNRMDITSGEYPRTSWPVVRDYQPYATLTMKEEK